MIIVLVVVVVVVAAAVVAVVVAAIAVTLWLLPLELAFCKIVVAAAAELLSTQCCSSCRLSFL